MTLKSKDTAGSNSHLEPLDCRAGILEKISVDNQIWSSRNENAVIAGRFSDAFLRPFGKGRRSKVCIRLPRHEQVLIGWRIQVPENAKPRTQFDWI